MIDAKEYGRALFLITEEENLSDEVLADVKTADKSLNRAGHNALPGFVMETCFQIHIFFTKNSFPTKSVIYWTQPVISST